MDGAGGGPSAGPHYQTEDQGNHRSTKAPARKAVGRSQGAEEEEETATELEDSESSQSFLSDGEEEAMQESHARYLFRKEYLSPLIVRAMRVLKLSDPLEKDPQTGMRKPASEADKVLLRCKRSYLHFAFPEFFEKQLKDEWAIPLAHRLNFVHMKKLYPFSDSALDFLKVPLVDAPVIGTVLGQVFSVDGGGSLKSVTDRNSELALCRTHEALALSVRASMATSLVARASILWTHRLLTESSAISKKHKDCLQMIEQASTFVADASLDTVRFSARAMASAVVVRRHLWLKSCPVDSLSKTNLATSSFLGGKVFGDILEDFLKEMKAGRYGSEEEEMAIESEDSEFLSDEEGEELSDEEEEPVQEIHTNRLFIRKDLSPLIFKAMKILELSDTLEEDRQARIPKGNERAFPRRKISHPQFAFPQFFEEEIKEAWAIPLPHKVNTSHTHKLYPFSRQMLDLIKVPIVDAPVTALISRAAFPRDGDGSLKCKADCDSELALCRAHETLALSIRASVATSLAARASLGWAHQLLSELSAGSQKFKEYLERIEKASAFMADGSLDSMRFSARAMASAVVARRHLWLKSWNIDSLSKTNVATYAFLGGKLFGDTLNRILIETKGKVKVLPYSTRRKDHPSRFQRVQSEYRKSRYSRPRPYDKPQYQDRASRPFSGDNYRRRFHNQRY
ncbi:UNVERIFIED_CONTAM: hypothetical protein K2H54_060713 [Gekko kuhli]